MRGTPSIAAWSSAARTRVQSGVLAVALATLTLAGAHLAFPAPARAAGPCDGTTNPVVGENSKPGTPESVWGVTGSGDPTIQGYATDISTNAGQTAQFKVTTTAPA